MIRCGSFRYCPNPLDSLLQCKFQFIALSIGVTFLCPNKKVTKEVVRGEALRAKCTTRPGPHSRRNVDRPLKMYRFSADSAEKTYGFVPCKHSKIGTFLKAGWRCGWWIRKEGAFARSASLRRLLLVLFLPNQEKYQEVRRGHRSDKLQFQIHNFFQRQLHPVST